MPSPLTHHESHILAIIRKWQPVTAYFVRKAIPRSLATTFSDSPGSIYPAIERLKKRELIDTEPGPENARKSELLSCTAQGEEAAQTWITTIVHSDLLPEDPWRTRVLLSEGLTLHDRRLWLLAMRSAVAVELDRILARIEIATDRFELDALENARLTSDARTIWIDRLIARTLTDEPNQNPDKP
ncbi:hypothetical protein GRI38_10840 [Altererythrobacter aurantiacus]|uniref:Transcription regulator PadR N-terminal domain-containing protein n=1 Tax=Parapontixanthobacter aurantiacus TaxID=1463599 RepID=A0A844ZDA0_9SPHN|nr:PadR family transcriptional regulator [Parapontixanthobacter aurantiacus]MXO86521.1 hypothetical protein [Parapontixanthobacter aurantiacus]